MHDYIYTVARLFETIYDPFRQHVKEDFFLLPSRLILYMHTILKVIECAKILQGHFISISEW